MHNYYYLLSEATFASAATFIRINSVQYIAHDWLIIASSDVAAATVHQKLLDVIADISFAHALIH